jgi:hypothetical protein
MFLFAIILLITTLVLSSLAQTSDTTTRLTNSTENVQLTLAQIEAYLQGAVAPNTAAASSQQSGASKEYTISSSYPCWGTSQPNTSGGSLSAPQITGIIIAHDFDFEFCSYVPGSAAPHVPHVIRVYMTTPCSTTLHTCTLALADYTKINVGFSSCTALATSCTSNNTYTATATTKPTTSLTVPNVSCDSYCYNAAKLDGTNTGASNSAYNVDNSAIACEDQTSVTCSTTATPPLFSYFAAGGPTGSGPPSSSSALNPSALPLMDVASSNSTVSDTTDLQTIQSMLFDLKIVGNNSPGKSTTKRSPSTTVSDQIYFSNLLTTVTAPFAATTVTAAANTSSSPHGIKVSWQAPYDGGQQIVSYTIIAYTNNGLTQSASTTQTATASGPLSYVAGSNDSYTMTIANGLVTGTSYTFTVQATNTANNLGGTSPASKMTAPAITDPA